MQDSSEDEEPSEDLNVQVEQPVVVPANVQAHKDFNEGFNFYGFLNTKVVDSVYVDEVDSIQFVDGRLVVEVSGLMCTQTPGKKHVDFNMEAARLYEGATHDELD